MADYGSPTPASNRHCRLQSLIGAELLLSCPTEFEGRYYVAGDDRLSGSVLEQLAVASAMMRPVMLCCRSGLAPRPGTSSSTCGIPLRCLSTRAPLAPMEASPAMESRLAALVPSMVCISVTTRAEL